MRLSDAAAPQCKYAMGRAHPSFLVGGIYPMHRRLTSLGNSFENPATALIPGARQSAQTGARPGQTVASLLHTRSLSFSSTSQSPHPVLTALAARKDEQGRTRSSSVAHIGTPSAAFHTTGPLAEPRRTQEEAIEGAKRRYFIEQQACSDEEIAALRERFGDAFQALTFQPPGRCHAHVRAVAERLAGQQEKPRTTEEVSTSPSSGILANGLALMKALIGPRTPTLSQLSAHGIPPEYAAVVVHARSGAADVTSEMVESVADIEGTEVSPITGSNHAIAILHVDTEKGMAYVFDPDYTRRSEKSIAMRAYCNEEGIEPHELEHADIVERGWLGELVRKIPTAELERQCTPLLFVGRAAIPRQ